MVVEARTPSTVALDLPFRGILHFPSDPSRSFLLLPSIATFPPFLKREDSAIDRDIRRRRFDFFKVISSLKPPNLRDGFFRRRRHRKPPSRGFRAYKFSTRRRNSLCHDPSAGSAIGIGQLPFEYVHESDHRDASAKPTVRLVGFA